MTVEVVVCRYCEDLAWLSRVPESWRITIYDKSAGGKRERIHLPGYDSPDGPDFAATWPGAVALPNVGLGDRSILEHIAEHYFCLADVTVFLQGNPFDHAPNWIEDVKKNIGKGYVTFGDEWTCDVEGRPHFDVPFPELRKYFELFWPGEAMPETLSWHGYSMFAVSSRRLRRISRQAWVRAAAVCETKKHSCALERLYDRLLGDDAVKTPGVTTVMDRQTMLALVPKGGKIAEVGVFAGDFSAEILKACSPSQLNLIDLWPNGPIQCGDQHGRRLQINFGEVLYPEVKRRFLGDDRVVVVKGDSVDVLASYPDGYFDFIYVDAAHEAERVREDLKLAARKSKGMIGGHDYSMHFPGVVESVDEICRNGWTMTAITADGLPSFILEKQQ